MIDWCSGKVSYSFDNEIEQHVLYTITAYHAAASMVLWQSELQLALTTYPYNQITD
jgi:hypothetical protein